jgi:phosphoribosylformimino-5-aminoimidazole carboxamide ribotide isomerase
MEIFPAIDIRHGGLARGHAGAQPATDPVEQAAIFLEQGAGWLHVVDMDRALKTGRENTAWVRRICDLPKANVQIGGNVDTAKWAGEMLDAGAAQIVLGTATALSGAFASLVALVGAERAALNLDVRGGRPAVRGGGGQVSAATPEDLARIALHYGVSTVVYRDLDKDGQALGADLDGAERLAATGVAVIAAGGVAGLDELRDAKRRGLAGVIVGRSLYEGRFGVAEALACSR